MCVIYIYLHVLRGKEGGRREW